MSEYSVLHSAAGDFSALLRHDNGAWKLVEGRHSLADLEPLTQGMHQRGPSRDYRVITVFLNNNCNLRCDYCRFDAVTHQGIEYGVRDVAAVVSSVRNLCRPGEQVDLHFQGGEPLLRAQDIDRICTALHDAPFAIRFHVTTNGTVATEAVMRVLAAHRISVTLSIDGLPEVHDAHRKFANGRGSFSHVRNTLELLRDRGIPFGVFCVVSEVRRMRETHDYLVEQLGLTSFVLAPLEIDGTSSAAELEAYLESFFATQLELLEQNIDRFCREGSKIREYLSELLLLGKVSRSFYSKACGDTPHSRCGERMHSIERNGDVLPCQNTRMIAAQGPDYLKSCLTRQGICENCEIRGHCSTPVCFSRLAPGVVHGFAAGEADARDYVSTACSHLKKRELALFDLFFRRKEDVLAYLTH
jgi:sulfatase maturation enzyme AslB (radical SAM superfamily)